MRVKNLFKLFFGVLLFNLPYVAATYYSFMPFNYYFKGFLDAIVIILFIPLREFSCFWGLFRIKK